MVKNNQPYHPHFTIGYRDIPKELFPEAMKDYMPRKFQAEFTVDAIHFWKHSGTRWETIASFPLRKKEESVGQASLF
jgi:2'-5' RNA ligase